jgi:phenylalanyl-tRNA synthetase beta chain
MSGSLAEKFAAIDPSIRLQNPISSDLDVMRPSILANLLLAAKRNAARGFADVGLFEVGPVYKNASPEGQSIVATSLRCGSTPRHWATATRPTDAFDAKADALAALTAAGAPVDSLQVTADAPSYYHPGRSGALRLGNNVLAYFGEIHPSLLASCDIDTRAAGAEVFIANIPEPRKAGTAKPLLKLEELQPVTRDFAFLCDRKIESAKLLKAVKGVDKKLIADAFVFDVYEGDKVAADKKSVALCVTIQPQDHSLTEEELESLASRISAAVTKATGATLRG